MVQRGFRLLTVTCTLIATLLAGCGGGGSSSGTSPLLLCGNGQIDPGEICDDGNVLDTDDCISTCVPARCGDGVVHQGFEDCDSFNLGTIGGAPANCTKLGFSGTGLRCTASCQYDTSACGPPFTATPLPTETPSPSPTPTPGAPTPTPTTIPCGNGVLEAGETCDTCPGDCVVLPCTAAPPIQTFQVNIAEPLGSVVSLAQVLVGYRSNLVSLPTPPGARIKNRPEGTSQLVNNLGYAVRVTIVGQGGTLITDGQLFSIDFDSCESAPLATPADFGCQVTQCSSSFGDVTGCTCTVEMP